MNELKQLIECLREDVHALSERVGALDEAIRGNGKPGLRAEHQALKQRVAVLAMAVRWAVGVGTTIGTAAAVWAITR